MFRLTILLATLMLIAIGTPALAQTVVGDWMGAITPTPGRTLHIVLHIKKNADGSFAGAMDSPDQGAAGLPVTIAASGGTLEVALAGPAPGGFAGKWDGASGAWVGEWKQSGAIFPLTLAPGLPAPRPVVIGLDGDWTGVLTVGTVRLRLVLHVKTGPDGTVASLDSPDQLAYGLGVASIRHDGDSVGFEMPALSVSFAGTLAPDGQSMAGAWTQAGHSTELRLARQPGPVSTAPPARPQTPVKPYPYREADVTFAGGAANMTLAGTLTLPSGAGPFPAVVLVAGSGPNTRDEPVFGHRPFLILADYLTRRRIAVLRYDKRGTGASSGDYSTATTMDFAADAEAAVAYLRGRPEIDAKHVGLIGHSEGGTIAPIVAARDPDVAFIVMMAGSGVDGAALISLQSRLIAKASGMDNAKVAESDRLQQRLISIVRDSKDADAAKPRLDAAVSEFAAAHGLPAGMLEGQATAINSAWFRFFLDYDPAPTLAKVRCPVLALIGSLDLQVPPDQNLPPIRAALAHNPQAEVLEPQGLNHLFQPAKTGAPGEYAEIATTIDPAALDLITGWVLKQVGPR